jgi:hypothetical protein
MTCCTEQGQDAAHRLDCHSQGLQRCRRATSAGRGRVRRTRALIREQEVYGLAPAVQRQGLQCRCVPSTPGWTRTTRSTCAQTQVHMRPPSHCSRTKVGNTRSVSYYPLVYNRFRKPGAVGDCASLRHTRHQSSRSAIPTSSAKLSAPIFSMMCRRCALIVFSLTPNSAATCLLSLPRAIRVMTSTSRSVS